MLLIFGTLSAWAQWDGTRNDSWIDTNSNQQQISTEAQLAGLAQLVNNGRSFKDTTFILQNNLDLNNRDWTPIGYADNYSKNNLPFSGSFDGQGFTISNLYINAKNITGKAGYVALFGHVEAKGNCEIKNLNLANININGANTDNAGYSNTAAFIALAKGSGTLSLTNCHVLSGNIKGGISGDNVLTAGVVADIQVNANLTNCSNSATINSGLIGGTGYFNYTGGLAARVNNLQESSNYRSTIEKCFNNGSIDISGPGFALYLGGLIGWLTDGTVSDSYNNGPLALMKTNTDGTKQHFVGGIAGRSSSKITNCYTTASISAPNDFTNMGIGGIVGHIFNGDISDCLAVLTSFPNQMKDSVGRIRGSAYGTVNLSNNYASIPGTTPGIESNQNGAEWGGTMTEQPISGWDPAVWNINSSGNYLPALSSITIQQNVPNPLNPPLPTPPTPPVDTTTYRIAVTIKAPSNVNVIPAPGTYEKYPNSRIALTVTLDEDDGSEIWLVIDNDTIKKMDSRPNSITFEYATYFKYDGVIEVLRVKNGVPVSNEYINVQHHIYTQDGHLIIETDKPTHLMVCDINGKLIAYQNISDGITQISLEKGFYIVQVGNKVHKFIINN